MKVTVLSSNIVAKVFPAAPNGDVLVIFTGNESIRLTNLSNGKSIRANVSGPSKQIFHPDGSVSINGFGPGFVFFAPTDVPPGPQAYIFAGNAKFTFTAAGQFILDSFNGTKFDVCAALS